MGKSQKGLIQNEKPKNYQEFSSDSDNEAVRPISDDFFDLESRPLKANQGTTAIPSFQVQDSTKEAEKCDKKDKKDKNDKKEKKEEIEINDSLVSKDKKDKKDKNNKKDKKDKKRKRESEEGKSGKKAKIDA